MPLENWPQGGLQQIERALRKRICGVCVDRNLTGPCQLDAAQECALFRALPQVVAAISPVHSNLAGSYVPAIRKAVCAECFHQDETGYCELREEARCALDRYLVLIIQTIEEFLRPAPTGPDRTVGASTGRV